MIGKPGKLKDAGAPLSRFKDGALIKARDNTVYRMSHVNPGVLGSVSMTLQRVQPKRPAGMSARQWDRKIKAQRRLERDRRERREKASAEG